MVDFTVYVVSTSFYGPANRPSESLQLALREELAALQRMKKGQYPEFRC